MQVDERLRIDEHAHIAELEDAVALARLRVEADVVAQARASAALHAQAQSALLGRNAFLDHGRADLGQRLLRDLRCPWPEPRLGRFVPSWSPYMIAVPRSVSLSADARY